MERRVDVFSFSIIEEFPNSILQNLVNSGEGATLRTNARLYASEEGALTAAKQTHGRSIIEIVINRQLATLTPEEIQQLTAGLPWSSKINSNRIKLESVSETRHKPYN